MVTELENKLKESSAKIDNAIANLKKENEDLRENVQQKENEIEGLKSELQKSISDTYVETESLKEEKENKDNPENQQLKKCLHMANAAVLNDSTLEDLHKKIDEVIEKNKKT